MMDNLGATVKSAMVTKRNKQKPSERSSANHAVSDGNLVQQPLPPCLYHFCNITAILSLTSNQHLKIRQKREEIGIMLLRSGHKAHFFSNFDPQPINDSINHSASEQ